MQALLILNLIVPFVMLLAAFQLRKHPVTDMQSHSGYNTPTSRKSKVQWDYAQKIAPDIFSILEKSFFLLKFFCALLCLPLILM